MRERKFEWYLDALNFLACLMVVFFHCNPVFYQYADTFRWKISVVERCVVYSAVPIFFMLSGATLLDYRKYYDTKTFLKKRLWRTGIPFLFWNVTYIAFNLLTNHFTQTSVRSFLSAWLSAGFQGRYWFFYPLFALYAAMPVLSLLVEHRRALWYTALTGALTVAVAKPILALCGIQYSNYLQFPLTGGFVFYALLGYLIATGKDWKKHWRWILYAITVCTEILAIVLTVRFSANHHKTVQYFVNYLRFPSMMLSVSIFVFFRSLKEKQIPDKIQRILRTVCPCNMGVWLTHSYAIVLFPYLTSLSHYGYLWSFGMPIVIYLLCMAGTWLCRKIPYLRHVV